MNPVAQSLNSEGYRHVVPPTQLDESVASTLRVAEIVGQVAAGTMKTQELSKHVDVFVPHMLELYEKHLRDLLDGKHSQTRAEAVGR